MAATQKLIFVVDDDSMLLSMLTDHLQQNPLHEVKTFSTGEECVANLDLHPDVIILDYHLNMLVEQAKDGLQILQEIKKLDKHICVVMLSSQSQYGKALQTIVKGALEYVVKDDDAFKRIDRILSGI